MALKVGDSVWLFDLNRRVYDKADRGGPIYREHFIERQIVGETRDSWLIEDGWAEPRRVNKRTMQTRGGFGLSSRVFGSREEVEDDIFRHDHRIALAERVRDADAATLRAVMALLDERQSERESR